MKNLFPLKTDNCDMSLRKREKFEVLKCKTERLKKSPIVYMQRLLNASE